MTARQLTGTQYAFSSHNACASSSERPTHEPMMTESKMTKSNVAAGCGASGRRARRRSATRLYRKPTRHASSVPMLISPTNRGTYGTSECV